MKNLYRRYKICQLLDEPLLDKDKEIIDFILDKIKDLTIFTYTDSCYDYMNSKGEFVFEQNEKNDTLWVRYEGFWSVLETKYLLNYDDIQDIIKGMIETIYKMKVETSSILYRSIISMVETAYKMSV